MVHLSLFEEDELLHARTMLSAQTLSEYPRQFSASASSRLTYYEATPPRKRTVGEALVRATEAAPLVRLMKSTPFTKPYGFLLQGLTVGLILVDPLDRLEGGLID